MWRQYCKYSMSCNSHVTHWKRPLPREVRPRLSTQCFSRHRLRLFRIQWALWLCVIAPNRMTEKLVKIRIGRLENKIKFQRLYSTSTGLLSRNEQQVTCVSQILQVVIHTELSLNPSMPSYEVFKSRRQHEIWGSRTSCCRFPVVSDSNILLVADTRENASAGTATVLRRHTGKLSQSERSPVGN